ncbi:MAG: HD domain-containing protein [Thermoleophilia bacterium]|nr:HD domain-containing protein [Thermoleophilia bacterium]
MRLPLLQPDALVTERVRAGLERAGVFAVYVNDAISEGIAPVEPISAELRDRAMRALDDTFTAVATQGAVTRIPGEQIERLGNVVKAILRELRSRREAVSSLMDLNAFDSHTLGHSLNVCILGLMIGDQSIRRHGWRDGRGEVRHGDVDDRLEKLGLGLLLHDIGKILIPSEILQKPGRLSDDEMEIVREHPKAGLDLIENGAFSSLSKVAVIGHHERLDGRGYPYGRADDLHPHAQIAGMADVYDAVSSMRVYQARRPTHEAWELVMSLAGTAFPIELVHVFKDTIAPYPEGVAVQLSDGRRGIVARVSRDHVTRPVVRVTHDPSGAPLTPHDLDLYEAQDVVIADTLQDLVGPSDPSPRAGDRSPDETHEQTLSTVLGATA